MPATESNNNQIQIHSLGVAEEVLGPGKRLIIWTSGCPLNCAGCIEPALQDANAGTSWQATELFAHIAPLLSALKKITISGGEPFFQAAALYHLISLFPAEWDLMIFSGYEWDYLKTKFPAILPRIDILISGKYVQEMQGNFLWRGSQNQIIHSPSHKYDALTLQHWMNAPSAGVEMFFEGQTSYLYGIPAQGVLDALYSKLQDNGISFQDDN